MDKTTNALNWFEIPVTDMPRARRFYETVFNIQMEEMNMGEMLMAGFPGEPGSGKASGALVKSEYHKPSTDGVVIYLNANPDMTDTLKRIEDEGAQIVMGKTEITPDIGYMAFFIDTEGNKIALHSQH